ncbi:hypothetical protein M0R72_18585 [Candidatus Pacearchaeota archaeon]|nr:hypothetical protein [Candidatus Pacearchaeota archaeon]
MKRKAAKSTGYINFTFSDETEIALTQLQIDELRAAFMEAACGRCWMKKTAQPSTKRMPE